MKSNLCKYSYTYAIWMGFFFIQREDGIRTVPICTYYVHTTDELEAGDRHFLFEVSFQLSVIPLRDNLGCPINNFLKEIILFHSLTWIKQNNWIESLDFITTVYMIYFNSKGENQLYNSSLNSHCSYMTFQRMQKETKE